MLRSELVACLSSWILDPDVLLVWVNLLLQREHSVGQLVGGHVDSSQVTLFQEIYLVGQSRGIGEFKRGRFFTP
jgi:hypothetical protein